jgi:two-component system sensor histidine kinase TtrS
VTAQAERAAGIIKHLRGFLRKRDPQRTNASINELVRSAAGLVAFEARELGVGVRFELADELSPVEVDKVQIEQVILNLVRNGLEAMRDGAPDGKELLIRTSADGSSGEVSVAVRDAGRGLSADELDRVFEAFYTTKAGGMGMGLSISRSIIEAHGGRLWAAENPGGGTTFRFALPAWPLRVKQ